MMWRSSHPSPRTSPDADQRLATFARGPSAEVRVDLAEFEGRRFVSLRLWERTPAGDWLPTKKGVTVRLFEVSALAKALEKAAPNAFAATEPSTHNSGELPRRYAPSAEEQRKARPRQPAPTRRRDGEPIDF